MPARIIRVAVLTAQKTAMRERVLSSSGRHARTFLDQPPTQLGWARVLSKARVHPRSCRSDDRRRPQLRSRRPPLDIHAHRGGTAVERQAHLHRGVARRLPPARPANGFVLEVDAKLTKDRVPIAIHDATLDRTTPCTGEPRTYTRDVHASCPPDVLGTPAFGTRPRTRRRAPRSPRSTTSSPSPALTGRQINLEIKNIPSDPDYDPTPAYANQVIDAISPSGLSRPRSLIIQSFWFPLTWTWRSSSCPRVAHQPADAAAPAPTDIALADATTATPGCRRSGPVRPASFGRRPPRPSSPSSPTPSTSAPTVRAAGRPAPASTR